MNTKRHLIQPIVLGLLLTLGSAGHANAVCRPSTYAYCWEQREMCLVNGGLEDDCNAAYFDCLSRRGCG
jgi:hypothetical protein